MEIKKDKYIIMDDNNKILFFEEDRKNNTELYVPEILKTGYDINEASDLFKNIIDKLDKESLIYLRTNIKRLVNFENKNKKLNKIFINKINKYYFSFKNFNPDEMYQISKEAEKKNLSPIMLSINEIRNLEKVDKRIINKIPEEVINDIYEKINYIRY